MREWSEITAYDGAICKTAKPLNFAGETVRIIKPTWATLVWPVVEDLVPGAAVEINFGGNKLIGSVVMASDYGIALFSQGGPQNGIELVGGTLVIRDATPYTVGFTPSLLGSDSSAEGHVTASNVVFNGFECRWVNASFDIRDCQNLGTSDLPGLMPYTFCTPEFDITVANFRVTFIGEFSGTVFDSSGPVLDLLTLAPYIDVKINGSVCPWITGAGASVRRASIIRLRDTGTILYGPGSGVGGIAGDVKVDAPQYGKIFTVGESTDFPNAFAFIVLESWSGGSTVVLDFLSLAHAFNVPGIRSSVYAIEGALPMSGSLDILGGAMTFDAGLSGECFIGVISQDASGSVVIETVISIKADTLIPTTNSLIGYWLVNALSGITLGGTFKINGTVQFVGGAVKALFDLGAGLSTAANFGVSGNTTMEAVELNNSALDFGGTFGAGVAISISGAVEIQVASYQPVSVTAFVAINFGASDVTISGEIAVNGFASAPGGGIAETNGGGNLRLSGVITLQNVFLDSGDFTWAAARGVVGIVELTGAVTLTHFRASGGGNMVILHADAGTIALGPATWRIDFGTLLMFLVLTEGAGVFTWVATAFRMRHVYADFPPQVGGAFIAAWEAYHCHFASQQTLVAPSTAYILVGADPALFVFFKCSLYAKIPGLSFPDILDDFHSLPAGAAGLVAGDLMSLAGGLVIPAAAGTRVVGVLFAAGPLIGDSAIIVTSGRLKVNAVAGTVAGKIVQAAAPPTSAANGVVGAGHDKGVGDALTAVGIPAPGQVYALVEPN